MRIEDLTVALRPRSAWEAVELGTALARRHAGAIWKPWLLFTLPVLVLLNALAWSIDALWLAGIAMWWLKPVFDRIPLYVLSRAVFGQVPTTPQTLRAQWSFGRGWLPAYLLWRRLGPVRSLYLPVDMLEGGRGEEARGRRRALGSPVYGVAALLTLVFANFEIALFLGAIAGVMLFVPNEFVQESFVRLWNVLESQPAWLQLAFNALGWVVSAMIEPFYIGAGFGLYLNRRTEIEAWDLELVLRRLSARLTPAVSAMLLVCTLGVTGVAYAADDQPRTPTPLEGDSRLRTPTAASTPSPPESDTSTLGEVFGDSIVEDAGWQQAIQRAYEDPRVSPKQTTKRWVPKNPRERTQQRPDASLGALGAIFAMIGEYGLWIVLGVIVLALLLTSRRWIGWLRDAATREGREAGEVQRESHPEVEPLPQDIPAAARRLWHAGRHRDALALVYRASVESMAGRANVVLVPGATEAHTLRASRQMPRAEDRDAFARAVRVWQTAAYAHGLPSNQDFDELLDTLAQRFAWHSATPAGAAA